MLTNGSWRWRKGTRCAGTLKHGEASRGPTWCPAHSRGGSVQGRRGAAPPGGPLDRVSGRPPGQRTLSSGGDRVGVWSGARGSRVPRAGLARGRALSRGRRGRSEARTAWLPWPPPASRVRSPRSAEGMAGQRGWRRGPRRRFRSPEPGRRLPRGREEAGGGPPAPLPCPPPPRVVPLGTGGAGEDSAAFLPQASAPRLLHQRETTAFLSSEVFAFSKSSRSITLGRKFCRRSILQAPGEIFPGNEMQTGAGSRGREGGARVGSGNVPREPWAPGTARPRSAKPVGL